MPMQARCAVRELRAAGNYSRFLLKVHTISPPTIVASGPPRKRLPLKGELRLFENDC